MSSVLTLTPRQQRFLQEFLVDLNATQAAIRAGYSPRTAKQQGSRLLTRPHIAEAVARAQATVAVELEITAEGVIAELAKIAFGNIGDYLKVDANSRLYIDLSNLSRDQAAALAEVTVEEFTGGHGNARRVRRTKFKLHDKPRALEQIGRHLGLFTGKKTTGTANTAVVSPSRTIPELDKLIAEAEVTATG